MLVKAEQRNIYILGKTLLRQNKVNVELLHNGQHIHYPPSTPPTMLDWAINFAMVLPKNKEERRLLDMLHLYPGYRWTGDETKRAAKSYKLFYQKMDEQRLYSIGNKWLNSGGRELINASLSVKIS